MIEVVSSDGDQYLLSYEVDVQGDTVVVQGVDFETKYKGNSKRSESCLISTLSSRVPVEFSMVCLVGKTVLAPETVQLGTVLGVAVGDNVSAVAAADNEDLSQFMVG